MNSGLQNARLVKSRWIVVGLAVLAATAFVLSVQGGRWWAVGDAVEIGPFGAKQCFSGECRTAGLGWLGGTERFLRTGKGAWAGGLIAGFVLLVLAAGVAAKRVPKLAAKTALVAIATTVAASVLFIAQFPGVDGAEVDRGIWLFVGATVAGIAAAIWVLRAPTAPTS